MLRLDGCSNMRLPCGDILTVFAHFAKPCSNLIPLRCSSDNNASRISAMGAQESLEA